MTMDNTTNNDTTCEELSELLYESHSIDWNWEENHIACLAHVLNLAVQEFLKNIKVMQMSEAERFALPGAAPAQLPHAPAPLPTKPHKRACKAKTNATESPFSNNPKNHDFGSMIKKLCKISAAINWPHSHTQDFWLFCKAKNLKLMKAVHDNDTRWSGTCLMIE